MITEARSDRPGDLGDQRQFVVAEFRPVVGRRVQAGGTALERFGRDLQLGVGEDLGEGFARLFAEGLVAHHQAGLVQPRIGLQGVGDMAVDLRPVARPALDLMAVAPQLDDPRGGRVVAAVDRPPIEAELVVPDPAHVLQRAWLGPLAGDEEPVLLDQRGDVPDRVADRQDEAGLRIQTLQVAQAHQVVVALAR